MRVAATLAAILIACALILLRRTARTEEEQLTLEQRHALNVERSRAIARRFRKDVAMTMDHLRAVTPHEFEEVVLTALAHRGHRIRRSNRYTGDGGADGQAWIRGRRYLIQSKRYRRAIRPEHIEDFARLCKRERARGLFVHTGNMGPMSLEADRRARRVVVLHGEALERLVAGRRVRLKGVRL
ncbi:restriction system protein [Parvularcula dongshanensis]|uniref:Restriction system protein n=1 Tax=Parvularcula dongshanensis TaxID=1173995 RepID=A0A840I7Q5_9PROT|nr:restriction system protein [Parvularcula dongshanensis]